VRCVLPLCNNIAVGVCPPGRPIRKINKWVATATHVRVGELFIMPVAVGIIVSAGLFLRDERLRALLPLRK
jgi:hypothetical protein